MRNGLVVRGLKKRHYLSAVPSIPRFSLQQVKAAQYFSSFLFIQLWERCVAEMLKCHLLIFLLLAFFVFGNCVLRPTARSCSRLTVQWQCKCTRQLGGWRLRSGRGASERCASPHPTPHSVSPADIQSPGTAVQRAGQNRSACARGGSPHPYPPDRLDHPNHAQAGALRLQRGDTSPHSHANPATALP